MPDKAHFINLLKGYLAGSLEAPEEQEFFHLIAQDSYRDVLEEALDTILEKKELSGPHLTESRLRAIEGAILGHPKSNTWAYGLWWKIAAGLLICLSIGFWLYWNQAEDLEQVQAELVLPPVESKATLSFGSETVTLDSLGDTGIVQLGPKLVNQDHIAYGLLDQSALPDTLMNTLRNPLGSRVVQVSLSDGTEVWLNAGSELSYPMRFGSGLREVKLKGEAYFEVEKGALEQGFVVHTQQMEVQVLGTKFNVNAYGDEPYTKTTLLEGAVQVQMPGGELALIHPGQQVYQTQSGMQVQDVDAPTYIAWKQGYFMFSRSSLRDIAKQLERWYQITVDYNSLPELHFTGGISKEVPLIEVLEMLENSSKVQFEFKDQHLKAVGKRRAKH